MGRKLDSLIAVDAAFSTEATIAADSAIAVDAANAIDAAVDVDTAMAVDAVLAAVASVIFVVAVDVAVSSYMFVDSSWVNWEDHRTKQSSGLTLGFVWNHGVKINSNFWRAMEKRTRSLR